MTVKQLIEELSQCNIEALVVLSSVASGNDYSPLIDIGMNEVYHVYEYSNRVEVYDEDEVEEHTTEIGDRPLLPCITLWPTN